MPTSDTNSFKQWPEDVLKVYGQLPLPTLHDFVLTGERVSSELRRQGKDLHKMVSAILSLSDKIKGLDDRLQIEVGDLDTESLSSDSFERSDEEDPLSLPKPIPMISHSSNEGSDSKENENYYPAWEVDMMRQAGKLEQRQWEEIYIAMLEVILQTFQENEENYIQLMAILRDAGINHAIELALTQLLEQHKTKLLSIRDQMVAHLKDINLEPITPMSGELYDEDIHRVIETLAIPKGSKNKRNTIARVIRIGYRRHSELVRQADVSLYG